MTVSTPAYEWLSRLDDREFHELADHQCHELIERFGRQSSAYFNLQADACRFGVADLGFIAYAPVDTFMGRVNMVFANPVCSAGARLPLLREFLKRVPGQAIFSGIDAEVANDLAVLGYNINELGTEFALRIADFSVAGKSKKQLRHASNLGKRYGLRVEEQTAAEVDQAQVRHISEAWRQHKAVKQHELRLLTRPPVFGDEWGVRKFYCYQEDRLLGCVFFDPFFEKGRVVGYTANILRQDMEASPSGLLDYIVLEAMKRFREEGIEYLSLGISPLYNVQAIPGDNPMIRWVCKVLYEKGNSFYAFKALSYHKSRYRAQETKWYLATRDTSVLKVAWSILRGTGVLGKPKIGNHRPARPVFGPAPSPAKS